MSSVQVTQTSFRHELLTLPREIRDDIYLAVLQLPSEPPPSPEDAGPRIAGFGSELPEGKNVFYPTDVYPKYACQNLQACNHQMNTEVREVLVRHDRLERGWDCKLDLMIHYCDIWPTWTLLPGPITHIRNLEVEMRIFDNCHGNQFGADGGPGRIIRPLFQLLSGLFHHGPQFVYKGSFDRQLDVDTMVFTIRDQMLNNELRKDAVEAGSPPGVLSIGRRSNRSTLLLLCMLSKIAGSGTLFGRVSKIKVDTNKGVKEISVPGWGLAQETVDLWDDYGFHWGVVTPSDHDVLG